MDRASFSGSRVVPDRVVPPLLLIYFLSGVCSLIYETVWIAHFSLLFGSTVQAMSLVVGLFFAGLALGSRWLGRVATRARHPVRLYALLEIAIGLYALLFPVLVRLGEALYAPLAAGWAGELTRLTVARAVLAGLILLPPTVLMGGTLPVLLRSLLPDEALTRRRAGLLYGSNALGAALGSALAGLLLLRVLGITHTNTTAALLNLALGLAALGIGRRASAHASAAPPARRPAAGRTGGDFSPAAISLVLAAFAVSGFVSMSFEIVWLRHLTFFFRDTVHLYTGIITSFVLGIGAGSLAAGLWNRPLRRPVQALGWILAGIGGSCLAATFLPIFAYRTLIALGERGAVQTQLLLLLVLAVPTFLMGTTFPLVSRIVTRDRRRVGESVGTAYALNTLGSILGTLGGGFVLFPLLGMQNTLYLLFGLNMLASTALLLSGGARRPAPAALVPAALALAFPVIMVLGVSDRLPDLLIRASLDPGAHLLEVREGATGTASVVRSAGGELKLMDNTVVIGRQKSGFPVVQGIIPLLVAPEVPRRTLGLAFGAGLSSYGARLFPEVERLDLVDISRENVDLALAHFPENQDLPGDMRARFTIDDAYNVLKYRDDVYDLIFVEPTPPMHSFRNAALYSREFYALARHRLSPGGLFAQILPLPNLSPAETGSVMRTFASVFPSCLLWWNHTDPVMIGSAAPLHLDPERIESRLQRPAVQDALRTHSRFGFSRLEDLLAGLLLDDAGFRGAAGNGEVYTDDRLGLKFSTGRELSPANIDAIAVNLITTERFAALLDGTGGETRLAARELARKRARFMAITYSPYPERFLAEFAAYMRTHPRSRPADLRILRSYLADKGFGRQAGNVDELLRQHGVQPVP